MSQLFSKALRYTEPYESRHNYHQTKEKAPENLPARFSPYQLIFSRSFFVAITPWLIMTQSDPVNFSSFNVSPSEPWPSKLVNHLASNTWITTTKLVSSLVDEKFITLLADFSDTFKFTQRISFTGFMRRTAPRVSDTDTRVLTSLFNKVVAQTDFFHLVELDVSGLGKLFDDKLLLEALSSESSRFRRPQLLQSLNVSSTNFGCSDENENAVERISTIFSKYFPHLVKLQACHLTAVHDMAATSRALENSSFGNTLEILDLAYTQIDAECLIKALSKYRKLHRLSLQYSRLRIPEANTSGFAEAIRKCPISFLDVTGSFVLSNENNLKQICEFFGGDTLRYLSIGSLSSGSFSREFLRKYLLKKCPHLIHLDMDQSEGLNEEMVKEFPAKLPHLRYLDVSDNYSIGKKAIAWLKSKYNGKLDVCQMFYDTTDDNSADYESDVCTDEFGNDDDDLGEGTDDDE